MRHRRRAEALGSHYEARLRGLSQATKVAFVTQAERFSAAVLRLRGLT